jgi:hypothetical protein
VLFSVSYFPDRPALLRANAQVHVCGGINKAAWVGFISILASTLRLLVCSYVQCGKIRSNWQFDLAFNYGIEQEISFILERPLIFELFGAAFTRRRGSPYYELRFPRVSAIHQTREASEAVSLSDIQRLGKDASSWVGSEAEDVVDDLWSRHSSTSGGESSGEEKDKESWRSRQEKYWVKKLSRGDKISQKKRKLLEEPKPSLSPIKRLQDGQIGRKQNSTLLRQVAYDGSSSTKPQQDTTSIPFWWTTYPQELQKGIHLSLEHHVHSWESLLQAGCVTGVQPCPQRAVIFTKAAHVAPLCKRAPRFLQQQGRSAGGILEVWLCNVPSSVQIGEGTNVFAPSSPFVLTKIM